MALFSESVNRTQSVNTGIDVTVDWGSRNVFQSRQIAQSTTEHSAVHGEDESQSDQSDQEPRNGHHDKDDGHDDNQNVLNQCVGG